MGSWAFGHGHWLTITLMGYEERRKRGREKDGRTLGVDENELG